MRCNVDGTDRPQSLDDEWVNDAEWGWVHYFHGWHTITGTRLKRLPDGAFVADSNRTNGPELPVNPEQAFFDVVGHPGFPSRHVTPEEWAGAE